MLSYRIVAQIGDELHRNEPDAHQGCVDLDQVTLKTAVRGYTWTQFSLYLYPVQYISAGVEYTAYGHCRARMA